MKTKLIAAVLIALPVVVHAEIPANATYITMNNSGGRMVQYGDSRCYSGLAVYSENPMQGYILRGCVTSADDEGMSVYWNDGATTKLKYIGWTKYTAKGM